MDAVEVLIAERPPGAPHVPAFADLAELKARIDAVKREGATERLDRVRQDLATLKADNRPEYDRQVAALRALIGD